MLINELRKEDLLTGFIANRCVDEDEILRVDVANSIQSEDILIIKPDELYASLGLGRNTPKSPDCLIVQRCANRHFHIYVIEFKNIGRRKTGLDLKNNISDKFKTCLNDLMSNRLREYFYNEDYKLKIHLVLVAGSVKEDKVRNFKADFLLTLRPLAFGGKKYMIQMKNPQPLINPC